MTAAENRRVTMGGTNEITRAIIIAAGMGSRLKPFTDDRPKCLLDVGRSTILGHAISTFRQAGLNDIAIVRGYQADCIVEEEVTYFENNDFTQNNILHSLFYASSFMDEGFVLSYSDILYKAEVVEALLSSQDDISVVVDRDWRAAYTGRSMHPLSEAEVVLDHQSTVTRIGKGTVPADVATGEFIGMARFTAAGARLLKQEFSRLLKAYEGDPGAPFQRAAAFRKAYLTDMLQEMADRGHKVGVTSISGGWMEIDTPEDYERALTFHG